MSTYTFSFEVGALVRSSVLFQLRRGANNCDVSLRLIDDGGWLSRKYQGIASGTPENVATFCNATQSYLKQLASI